MITERDISTITVNQVIEGLVRFLDSAMGSSSLAVQLGILSSATEGVFTPRDDGDKTRAAFTAENAMVARVDLAGLWKSLSPNEREVIRLLNTPGNHERYEEVIPTVTVDRATGEEVATDLEHEIVVGFARNEDEAVAGVRVLRTGRSDLRTADVARMLGLPLRHVEAIVRKARKKIRRVIWEKQLQLSMLSLP